MDVQFVARSQNKGPLDISKKIIEVTTVKANEECLEDLQQCMALLKKLGYKIDS